MSVMAWGGGYGWGLKALADIMSKNVRMKVFNWTAPRYPWTCGDK